MSNLTRYNGSGESSSGSTAGITTPQGYTPQNHTVKGYQFSSNGGQGLNKLYHAYRRFSPVAGVMLYLGLSIPYHTPFLPVHFFVIGFLFWRWKVSTEDWATYTKSTAGKLCFFGVFLGCQILIAGMLPLSPPAAYIVAVAVAIIFNFIDGKFDYIPADRYISGAQEVGAAWWFNTHQKEVEKQTDTGTPAEYVNFLGLLLTSTEATLNFLFFGEVRSGKSIAISMLLPILCYENKRALVYDYANNYLAKFLAMGINEERIIILNAFYDGCCEWLLSLDLVNPPITRVFFEQLFQSKDPRDEFFVRGARNIACDVVETLNRVAKDNDQEAVFGIRELAYFCTDQQRLIELLQSYPDIWRRNKGLATGSEQQQAYFGTLANVFQQLLAAGECWYAARQNGRTVGFKDFHSSNNIVLLGRNEQLGGEALRFFNAAVINFCLNGIIGKTTSDSTKPAETFLVLDEFQSLGKLQRISTATSEGGKLGICSILATQSYQIVEDTYGKGDTAQILGNITHLGAFKVTENSTAEYLSKYFGETTVMEATVSNTTSDPGDGTGGKKRSKSLTWTEKTKFLYTPANFKSQSKINPASQETGLMEVTVRCDQYNYRLRYHWQDILPMLPPKPTAAQEKRNTSPQPEGLLYPRPLTDQELINLGLAHMVEQEELETPLNNDLQQDKDDLEIDFEELN